MPETQTAPANIAAGGGVAPAGFDINQIVQQVAGAAAQALPGLIMGLLSAHPQLKPQSSGVSPQGLFNFGVQTPFGGVGLDLFSNQPQVRPQGFDIGQIAQQVAGAAAQALPGLILGLLSAHPQLKTQSASAGVSPQGLFNFGVQTPFGGGGISLFGAQPQVSPQGFDIGQIAQQVAGAAAQALPGLILGLLSAHPQLKAQSAGVSPQGLFNLGVQTPFGGGGMSLFGANPQLLPQGFDLGQLAQQISTTIAQQIPTVLSGILSTLSASPRVA